MTRKSYIIICILCLVLFQKCSSAEDRDFREEIRRVRGWQENQNVVFLEAPVPLMEERVVTLGPGNIRLHSLSIDDEPLTRHVTRFEGQAYGNFIEVYFIRFLEEEGVLKAEVSLRQGENESIELLDFEDADLRLSNIEGDSLESLRNDVIERGRAQITSVFSGVVNDLPMTLRGEYSTHVPVNLGEMFYAVDRTNHLTETFMDLFVNINGRRHYLAPRNFRTIPHNMIGPERERILEDVVELQGNVPHRVRIREVEYQTISREEEDLWPGLESITYPNRIDDEFLILNDVVYIQGEGLEDGVRYRTNTLGQRPSGYIYSAGEENNDLYSTTCFEEEWHREENPVLVRIWKQGFKLPPRQPDTVIIGLALQDGGVNIWPRGIYGRRGDAQIVEEGRKRTMWRRLGQSEEEVDPEINVTYRVRPFWEKFRGFDNIEALEYWSLVRHIVIGDQRFEEAIQEKLLRGIRRKRLHLLDLTNIFRRAVQERRRGALPRLDSSDLSFPLALGLVRELRGVFYTDTLVFDMSWGEPLIDRFTRICEAVTGLQVATINFPLEWLEDLFFVPVKKIGSSIDSIGMRITEKGLFGEHFSTAFGLGMAFGPTVSSVVLGADILTRGAGYVVRGIGKTLELGGESFEETSKLVRLSTELILNNGAKLIGFMKDHAINVLGELSTRVSITAREMVELKRNVNSRITSTHRHFLSMLRGEITPREFIRRIGMHVEEIVQEEVREYYRGRLPEGVREVLNLLRQLRGTVYRNLRLSGTGYIHSWHKISIKDLMGEEIVFLV